MEHNKTAIDFLITQIQWGKTPISGIVLQPFVSDGIIEKARDIEKKQMGYSKKDVMKATQLAQINPKVSKLILSLLDEAKELNKKSN